MIQTAGGLTPWPLPPDSAANPRGRGCRGHLSELYGPGAWELGAAELTAIHESTRAYTSNLLPGPFFLRLVALLSADEAQAPAPSGWNPDDLWGGGGEGRGGGSNFKPHRLHMNPHRRQGILFCVLAVGERCGGRAYSH